MNEAEIFDRRLRRLRRDRAARLFGEHDFLIDHMLDELMFRLDGVKRQFASALVLGAWDGRIGRMLAAKGIASVAADAGFAFAAASGGVQCDEDRLPFADAAFDMILAAGVLDSVNDLPGALVLARRALRPDGLLLGAFVGAGSLPRLRAAVMTADMEAGGAIPPRLHPQIDVRAAGDLLQRAGFALPVADGERLTARYGDPFRLASDLRGMAGGNLLRGQTPPAFGRSRAAALAAAFAAESDADGRTRESFEIVYLTGWAPSPDQPKPARRGSATASMADALRPPPKG